MSRSDTLIGSSPALLRSSGVDVRGRLESARGVTASFVDGRRIEVQSVVWATGFRPDYSWLDVPVLDARGVPLQQRGVTQVPGFYLLGLPWMHTRGSALLGWVGRDAAHIASIAANERDRATVK